MDEYRGHPESKSFVPDGTSCSRATRGLLLRRPVLALLATYIGKESNRLDDTRAGLIHDARDATDQYIDSGDPWVRFVLPILRLIPRERLAQAAGIHPRKVAAIRNGHASPRHAHRIALLDEAGRFAQEVLAERGLAAPRESLAACAKYVTYLGTALVVS